MTGFFSAWWGSAVTVFVCVITWAMAGTEGLAAPDATKSIPDPATQPQLAKIEELLRRSWSDYGLSPASRATDGEWCRRVYLDLLGRVPTVDELQAFTTLRERDKDAQLVERLLTDSLYTEEYARNFTTLWTNILIGRNGGNEDRSLTNRAGLQKYLRDSFARNKPYDQLARELITATGASQPGRDGFNGAVNFLAMKLADDAMLATADTARIFLGLQVQCTQCHNHPFNEWKQNQYWELNAFFRQTRSLRRFEAGTNEVAYIELADQDFGGEGTTPQDAEIYYELRNGQVKAAYPVFVDGTKISTSGYLADVRRRGELGRLVTDSEYLSRAIVNRMWGQFLGYGFTKPVDDMGPHNAPSHPELLDYLASEFRAANYDLKTLIRWITLNPAYRLSSRTTKSNASDDPLMGEPPKFSHFYLRQLRAEELYESLLVATQADQNKGSYEEREMAKNEWLRQFTIAFGTDEGDETTTFNGSIPQVLMMFNGELVKEATRVDADSFLSRVAANPMSPAKKIEFLYLAALARKPTRPEIDVANKLWEARAIDARRDHGSGSIPPGAAALQDVWWVLLNSNEFILNH